MTRESLQGRPISSQLERLRLQHRAARQGGAVAGFFNSISDGDGVVRSIPLLAEYKGQYYESLSLAMFRMLVGCRRWSRASRRTLRRRSYQGLDSICCAGRAQLAIPVDDRVATLVPFRGPGGAAVVHVRLRADVIAKRCRGAA
jgi:adenylate cyclase